MVGDIDGSLVIFHLGLLIDQLEHAVRTALRTKANAFETHFLHHPSQFKIKGIGTDETMQLESGVISARHPDRVDI